MHSLAFLCGAGELAFDQTDVSGIAKLPIQHGGVQIIAIDYKAPPTHPDLADHGDYSASLTFELP